MHVFSSINVKVWLSLTVVASICVSRSLNVTFMFILFNTDRGMASGVWHVLPK